MSSRVRISLVFLSTVSIEKCLFGLINGIIFFPTKKKWMLDSKIFTFFKPKNDLFGDFLDSTYFRAAGPKKKIDPKKNLGTFFFFLKKNSAGGYPHPW